MRHHTFALLLACGPLAACGNTAPPPPQYRVVTLASGKQVKTLGVQRLNFPESGPALMLSYLTDVPISDTTALAREAAVIWEGFRLDANNARVNDAILNANAPPSGGIVSRSQSFNFVYGREPDGSWHRK